MPNTLARPRPRARRGLGGLTAALALLLLLASPARGEDRTVTTALPVPASIDPDLPRLDFERYTLDNGLEVILHPDRSAPLVAVNVWYHVGSGDEVVGRSGFAHLFEHMMFQGSKHTGRDAHFNILRQIGGTEVNGTTNPDRTNYYEVVPSNQLATALWLESDRMGYMLDVLTQESLDNQRAVVRNERRQRYDNVPYGAERFAVARALYPEGHPYRYLTIGRHKDLEAATLDDVRDFFTTWYVPSNATLTLAGDFDPAEAKALVERWFGAFPKLPAPDRRAVPTPTLAQTQRETLQDRFAKLRRLHYVWHSPPYLASGDLELDILAKALGASGWGRLYRLLVLEHKLAQNVGVYQASRGHSSAFHVVVTLRPNADQAKAERLLQDALQAVQDAPLTADELRRATRNMEANTFWGLEPLMARANRLQSFNHFARDPGYLTPYLQRRRDLTADDVLAAAKATLGAPGAQIITLPATPKPSPKP